MGIDMGRYRKVPSAGREQMAPTRLLRVVLVVQVARAVGPHMLLVGAHVLDELVTRVVGREP